MHSFRHKKISASGLIYTGKCVLGGFTLGLDGANDQEITVFDNVAAAGNEAVPTNTYDASALGLNGMIGIPIECENGIYVEAPSAGTKEITVYYKEYANWGVF